MAFCQPQYRYTMTASRSPDRVEEWLVQLGFQEPSYALEKVDSESEENGVSSTPPHPLDDKSSKAEDKKLPATPVRSRETFLNFDEVSPTDTSFSYDTIFDTPEIKEAGERYLDDVSDTSTTTIDEVGPDWSSREEQMQEHEEKEYIVTPSDALSSHSAGNHNSICPPSSTLSIPVSPDDEQLAQPPCDRTKPRLVWITSCLQCTLVGLPCSRTPPSCSRCARKGDGDICLLRRRKMAEERVRGDRTRNRVGVLLKIKGQDEVVWGRKKTLEQELTEAWRESQGRKNWVLPMNGVKGDYWRYGSGGVMGKRDIGEGMGRQTFAEMVLS
jgi:hypothetical protein